VVIEAWMSKNINLLYKSVGKEKDEQAKAFDPVDNIGTLGKGRLVSVSIWQSLRML
jgi:hypothetical protein